MRHDFLHSQVAIDGEAGGKDEDIYCQKQWEKLNIILYERAEFTFWQFSLIHKIELKIHFCLSVLWINTPINDCVYINLSSMHVQLNTKGIHFPIPLYRGVTFIIISSMYRGEKMSFWSFKSFSFWKKSRVNQPLQFWQPLCSFITNTQPKSVLSVSFRPFPTAGNPGSGGQCLLIFAEWCEHLAEQHWRERWRGKCAKNFSEWSQRTSRKRGGTFQESLKADHQERR